MINATELRIGNWLQCQGLPPEQVTLDTFYAMHEAPGSIPFLSPIELTPDILEKCGFTTQEGYDFPTYEDQYGDRISFDGGIWKYWLGGIYQDWAEIRSLHRLQNFYFEYTNRELEVKL